MNEFMGGYPIAQAILVEFPVILYRCTFSLLPVYVARVIYLIIDERLLLTNFCLPKGDVGAISCDKVGRELEI